MNNTMTEHKQQWYAIVCRDAKTNQLLGRLTPEGHTTNRNIYAMMLPKQRAEEIAEEINQDGEFIAKVIKF